MKHGYRIYAELTDATLEPFEHIYRDKSIAIGNARKLRRDGFAGELSRVMVYIAEPKLIDDYQVVYDQPALKA